MSENVYNPWLHRFTVLSVLCTFVLITMGGLVTSREAGLTVPDWPTSFGYNMFLLPFDQWLGKFGIFEEHAHRLMASIVGLLTATVAIWMWARESAGRPRTLAIALVLVTLGLMGVRTQTMFVVMAAVASVMAVLSIVKIIGNRSALRWWAALAYSMVIVQGVLGGLRVTQLKDQIGVLHGTLAQIFLIVLTCIALFTSRWWKESRAAESVKKLVPQVVRSHFFYATLLIFLQLILGATMRHQHAGLPVWDFPKAHGQWWPSTEEGMLSKYNADRTALQNQLYTNQESVDARGNPTVFLTTGKDIQASHISLHMFHRVMAVLILGLVLGTTILAHRKLGKSHALSKLSLLWLGLVLIQATLGILTVLKYKPADIATLHVLFGAATLLTGAMGTVISRSRELPACLKGEEVESEDITQMEAAN
tara:strand:- start:264 stop:1529 length:1266 start_codon:yes stop_codon:yes gene_type:complete